MDVRYVFEATWPEDSKWPGFRGEVTTYAENEESAKKVLTDLGYTNVEARP